MPSGQSGAFLPRIVIATPPPPIGSAPAQTQPPTIAAPAALPAAVPAAIPASIPAIPPLPAAIPAAIPAPLPPAPLGNSASLPAPLSSVSQALSSFSSVSPPLPPLASVPVASLPRPLSEVSAARALVRSLTVSLRLSSPDGLKALQEEVETGGMEMSLLALQDDEEPLMVSAEHGDWKWKTAAVSQSMLRDRARIMGKSLVGAWIE